MSQALRQLLVPAACLLAWLPGCARAPAAPPAKAPPDIVWVVWDTVRADRLSLYGYGKVTTPHLDEWAREARVFTNCLAPGSTTVPSHASMFTGLLPAQHGAGNEYPGLDDAFETVAELLHAAGYATYAYSENPFITAEHNFVQGFDLAEQPSDEKYLDDVTRITWERMAGPQRASLTPAHQRPQLRAHVLKAPEVVQRGVEQWLARQRADQPVLLFLNYMGAHEPLIPAAEFRRQMMPPRQVARSYTAELDWVTRWLYTFGLVELRPAQLARLQGLYDAAILELDDHFQRLLQSLERAGRLKNAIVILTSDHGEHLGDHHMVDHQFSVYERVLRVPLVVRYSGHFPPGRDDRPVVLHDLFPTLLELAGTPLPAGWSSDAVSLLTPPTPRRRLAEYPAPFELAFDYVERARPGFDRAPWQRALRAYYDGRHKLIWGSDGRHELYDLVADPEESRSLFAEQSDVARRLAADLEAWVGSLKRPVTTRPLPELSPEQRRRLGALGYAEEPAEDEPDNDDPP